MRIPLNAALILCAALPYAQAGSVEFDAVSPWIIQQRLETLSQKLAERRTTLERLFEHDGCTGENLTTQPVRGSKEPNLICTLRGQDPAAGTIVVGGHFDLITAGMGAVDDWSGVVLLPSLYQSLRSRPRRHDFVFIAFAAEEAGLNGSHEYVHQLSREQRTSVRAMINLECLGLTPPKIWASRADPRLLEAYARVVEALRIQPAAVNVERVGDDDSHPFRDAHIATLTIHSITQATLPILHTSRDRVSAIHAEDYYAAYRVAATLLAFLDND
jgi:aminopeptidase YwaD